MLCFEARTGQYRFAPKTARFRNTVVLDESLEAESVCGGSGEVGYNYQHMGVSTNQTTPLLKAMSVSYTHLTLPTILLV